VFSLFSWAYLDTVGGTARQQDARMPAAYLCVCVRACARVCLPGWPLLVTQAHLHAHARARAHTHTHTHTHTHMYMCVYVCICVYMCVYVCMSVCVYMCVHTYTHTHTHTLASSQLFSSIDVGDETLKGLALHRLTHTLSAPSPSRHPLALPFAPRHHGTTLNVWLACQLRGVETAEIFTCRRCCFRACATVLRPFNLRHMLASHTQGSGQCPIVIRSLHYVFLFQERMVWREMWRERCVGREQP
jgi:hypothetical protein